MPTRPIPRERSIALARCVRELAQRFVGTRTADLDATIQSGLGELGVLVGADRVFLLAVDGADRVELTHVWQHADVDAAPSPAACAAADRYRWYGPHVRARQRVHIQCMTELPAEELAQCEELAERGVCSALGIPVPSEDGSQGYLGIECETSRRDWLDDEIELLTVAAGVFFGALRLRQAEAALQRELAVTREIAELARRFIQLGVDEIADGIREGLAAAGPLAGADRCYLLAIGVPDLAGEVFEWHRDGVAAFPGSTDADYIGRFRWSLSEIAAKGILQIADPAALPLEAAPERGDLVARGVRSSLGLLLRSANQVVGYLNFECLREGRRWADRELTQIRLMADVFGSVLYRQQTERELLRSRAELTQAQKMEAVGRMAGGIAHDFNNLLTVILGNAQSVLDDIAPYDPRRQEAEEILVASERAAALTRQILAFSRHQPHAARNVDLNRVVAGLERMLGRLISEDVELRVEKCEDSAIIRIDPTQLEQVVVNLVVNARAAVSSGGRISLRTECRWLDAADAPRLGMVQSGEVVVLTVRDTGCGMDESTRARIFDPFFTTRGPGSGSGLGLAIVYSVVKQCGGAIHVMSEPEKGSEFELFFPRQPVEDRPSPVQVPATTHASGTVLLVEDERSVRRLARRALERAGYRVLEAADGFEALAMAASANVRIDLLLTDIVMPRMGGVELATKLGKSRPGLPVLFMSGYPHGADEQGEPVTPPGDLLEKPFSGASLLIAVDRSMSAPPDR